MGFSLPNTSKIKQAITSRGVKKAGSNPSDQNTTKKRVFLTEGFAKTPLAIPEGADKARAADFYREGSKNTDGTYDTRPFQVDEFVDIDSAGKEKDPIASIRIFGRGKSAGQATSTSKDLIPSYTKFILENVQEAHTERSQVVETFGDFYVFFFGERPPVYNFSGTLINSRTHNWLADFMFLYENFLRGTRCVENKATALITYGGRQIEGFIMNTSNATAAISDKGVQISFQVLVIDRKILQLSADFGVAIVGGSQVNDQDFIQLLENSGLSRAEVSRGFELVSQTMAGEPAAGAFETPFGTLDSALGIPSGSLIA